jgi:hypothetical protein
MADLLLATEGAQVVQFNTETKAHSVVFQCSDDEAMMGIARYKDHLYVASGVAVFDEDFRLNEKFEYGWETHDFQFIDGKRMAICATSSKRKKIHHPRISGIMLEGELVFEHDSEESFCKGLTYDKDFLYLCGGRKQARAKRKNSNGVICVLNRKDFSLAEQFESEQIKAVKAVIVAE